MSNGKNLADMHFFDAALALSKNIETSSQIAILPSASMRKVRQYLSFIGADTVFCSPTLYSIDGSEPKKITELIHWLTSLLQGNNGIYLLPAELITYLTFNIDEYRSMGVGLSVGESVTHESLSNRLIKSGFERTQTAERVGSFSITGESIIIYQSAPQGRIQVTLDFDTIASISSIATNENFSSLYIFPQKLAEGESRFSDMLTFLHGSSVNIHLLQYEMLEKIIDPLDEGLFDVFEHTISKTLTTTAYHELASQPSDPVFELLHQTYRSPDEIKNIISQNNYTPYIFTRRSTDVEHYMSSLEILFKTTSISHAYKNNPPTPHAHIIEVKTLRDLRAIDTGIDHKNKIIFLTDAHIFKQFIPLKQKRKVDESFILSLSPGDFVVHIDHGIGIFHGMKKRKIDDGFREYFLIEYAKKDKIYLPIEYAEKITKYIGDAAPRISRLHELSFKSITQTIKKDAKKIAKQLIQIQAERKLRAGVSFLPHKDERRFIDEFPFDETACQLTTWDEVSADLEKNTPMDRIVCGDVGFGKTEIAMRAAFRVASNSYQVAVLSPTTVLSSQHFESFQKRFTGHDFKICELSRMTSSSDEKKNLEMISSGTANIIIGTHRLLSKDIQFKKLGLIIVDEEQRFGVKHKEKLKEIRSDAHVLTLTATPIPRTLHMSLAGLRDISTITTPPTGRKPVNTIIQSYQPEKVMNAIEHELERNGKVFYLHNRVRTIGGVAHAIQSKLKEAKVGVVHGQLPATTISKTMHDFQDGKLNVLVCSSIIENGIDMPHVNTLIIEEATQFGLSQLYQLRGRVGRGNKKASAFFFYRSQKLTGVAKQRLKALQAAKKLGSGFEIALKDLEIRGAGNILGKEQSGQVQTVGLTHYVRILNNAIEEIKSGKKRKEIDVSIDLPIDAYIPEESITEESERLRLYQFLAQIGSIKELKQNIEELMQGISSEELENLGYILELKILSEDGGIKNIDTKIYMNTDGTSYKKIVLQFIKGVDYEKAFKLLRTFPFLEIEEEKIKMDFSKLGPQWKKSLHYIVTSFAT